MITKKILMSLVTCIGVFLCSISNCTADVAPKKETTFALIKPEAVAAGNTGIIISTIELNKFTITRMQKMQLPTSLVELFYCEHKERPFFKELVSYITSGPVIALILEKPNAVKEWRELMGSTDPLKSGPGTIRRMFGKDKTYNAVHGSDSIESAQREINLIFDNHYKLPVNP